MKAFGSTPGSAELMLRWMPAVFVLIWSTGFVVARYGMPHAPPFTFLSLRFALSLLAFGLWVAWSRPAWPQGRAQWFHLAVTGALIHASYLGGVWAAVKGGMGAGLVALLVGLQPVLTALWLSWQGPAHRVTARQWLGLGLGLSGLLLVVMHKLQLGLASWPVVAMALAALLGITVGTLYQKRWVLPCDVRSASVVQLLAALLVLAPLAAMESEPIVWHPQLWGALAWSVLVLTLGGSSLLYLLIQRGAATSVSSLMYLVPPTTALMAAWLFAEPLSPPILAGLVLSALGVALVLRVSSPTR